tara:strand:- start:2573 stop:3160 length:588 start_codon:yes stop_codon:yes gene_type:complete
MTFTAAQYEKVRGKGGYARRGTRMSGATITMEVDAKEILARLDGLEKYTAIRVLNTAGTYATRIIDARTRDLYLRATWKSKPRKSGFRKRIKTKGAFRYTTKANKYGTMKFTSGFNYRYPEMRLGFLLERGHSVAGTETKTKPMNLRKLAYKQRVHKARQAFAKAFKLAFELASNHPKGYVSMKVLQSSLGDPWK